MIVLPCSSAIMKVLVALVLFVAAAQAKSVGDLVDLPFVQVYKPLNPSHTAEEWDEIYAAAEADIPEDTTGLVPGTEPQPESAGMVFVEPASERIIGGSTASQGQFPWQAMLVLGGSSLCGGSLISKEWILTAAHCVHGINSFRVTLGSTSRTSAQAGSVTQNARQAIAHQSYNDNSHANDIALLRLTTAVALGNHINVVRLPSSNEAGNTFAGSSAIVSGFGRTSSSSNAVASNLLFINTQVITNAVCARSFGSTIISSNICTLAAGGRSACNGDSGGPLVVQDGGRYTLVGAVSFGAEHCPANAPNAFARVTSFLAWISSHSGVAV